MIDDMSMTPSTAFIYGVVAGIGGLGLQAATALTALAEGEASVHAYGPGRVARWPLSDIEPAVLWHESPQFIPSWAFRYSWWRWYQGQYQLQCDRRLGSWARSEVEHLQPQRCYVFTQVGLETLRWARSNDVPTVLDNPNGHIRDYWEVFNEESLRWCGHKHIEHPTMMMVERVEEEYELADRIRVSSQWAKDSMVARGVSAGKIQVVFQPLNLSHFYPASERAETDGPLRICYVGNLNLAKGFTYLLRAIKAVGSEHINLEVVGSTGSRSSRRLFERERRGLAVASAPGNPVPAYQRAEVFVMPSLHDGFGFVVAEAMACGLPVIVTEDCGAASWVSDGVTGWVIPSGEPNALAHSLKKAMRRRHELKAMGELARTEVERRAGSACLGDLCDWFYQNS